ncbi:MAG: AMP-binding protein, partial [Myxococcota bacterium]
MAMTTPSVGTGELAAPGPGPLLPTQLFSGRRFIVVGGTGFLGKVWVSMFLHHFPNIDRMYLMVRPKGAQSSEERFWAEVASSEVFDPIRQTHPGKAYEDFMRSKVVPIPGDVSKADLGIDPDLLAELERDQSCAAVVNVAGVVDFNPPLDEALNVNAFGVNNLIELSRRLSAPLMHTSTCYVAGYRTGVIDEVDPREVPFPRAKGADQARLVAKPDGIPVDRQLERSHWDPQNEIQESLDVIKSVRQRCEDQFRQSKFLDEAKENLLKKGEPCRGQALEDEIQRVKRKFLDAQLTEAGMERALYWGWPNIYTYTKSIGEQVLAASGIPYTIVRPAVVESASFYPFPTWNEGINTSAPYIYLALKGQSRFATESRVHLDIIPVDMVCAGMIAGLAELLEGTAKPVYQFGATDSNPCRLSRYMELIGLYKRKKWQDGGDEGNRIMNAILARFEPVHLTKQQYLARGPHAVAKVGLGLADIVESAGVGPVASVLRPAAKAIRKAAKQEDRIGDLMDLFLPFTVECDWIFSCANTRAAIARMPPEEQAKFCWEPEKIDWRDWMFDVHIPGIEKWAGPVFEERLRRETKPLRPYDHLLALLEEVADRFDHQVALRYLEEDGFSRITFVEWRDLAAVCAARLHAVGVQPGDRVILSAENRPAWPIAYFGILWAGAVAVPLDPKLGPTQVGNVVRSSGARVGLLGAEVLEVDRDDQALSALSIIDVDEITAPDHAGMVNAPGAPAPGRDDLASIIYTSGTTGDPKGVMLTHGNITSLLAAIMPLFPLKPHDGVLSVLPLHHTFEFSCGMLLPMASGSTINYLGELDADRLGEGLEKGNITAMVGVPALWQLIERRLENQIKERGPMAARYFDFAAELNRALGRTTGLDAGRVFFRPVHQGLGGRVKYLISGGSALPKSTADKFRGLGLKISEGYGLTEASPVLTVAKASPRSRSGQVGTPIPG